MPLSAKQRYSELMVRVGKCGPQTDALLKILLRGREIRHLEIANAKQVPRMRFDRCEPCR